MITISKIKKELLQLDIKLISGDSNQNRQLEYVTILELPEKTDRFKERGLVLSTFQSFNDTTQIKEQITWLQTLGIVGIGFHTAYYKKVPKEIIDHSNKIDMPLFSIPVDVPYHKILDIFNQLENNDLNFKTYEIYRINEKMMDSVYKEKDDGYIINLMGNYIKKSIILLDSYLKVKAIWKEPGYLQDDMDKLTRTITSTYKEALLQTRFFKREANLKVSNVKNLEITLKIIPISSNKDFLGYLLVDKNIKDNFYSKEVIRLGIRALSLNKIRIPSSNNHNKIKDIKKLESILSDDNKNIPVDEFYISIHKLSVCLRIGFPDLNTLQNASNYFNEVFLAEKSNALTWIYEDTIIAFLENNKDLKEFHEVLDLYTEKSVGISSIYSNTTINNLRAMNRQAITAMKYSDVNHIKIAKWDELGIERIAFNILDSELFNSLDNDILGNLIEYDDKKNSELMLTLEYCLKNFFNLKEVGKKLHVHPNTVKYRLSQITKIIDINIYDHSNFALFVTAFEIYKQRE